METHLEAIGKATLIGPSFNITVEVGTRALIRCYSVHKVDVAQWAMEQFEGGRVGQAQVLFEMQVVPGEFSIEQILENWFLDMDAYGNLDFQKELLRVLCEITGAKYKALIAELDAAAPQDSKKKDEQPA